MLLPNETTVATPTAVSVYVWLWLQIIENIGISASLSAELTGQYRTVSRQVPQIIEFVGLFLSPCVYLKVHLFAPKRQSS